VTENDNNGPAGTQLLMDGVEILDLDAIGQSLQRYGTEFDAAKQIRAQTLKMLAYEPVQFPQRFFIAKSDLDILQRQTPISPEEYPGAKAERISQRKKRAQRQYCDQGKACAIKQINKVIEHWAIRAKRAKCAAP
jgi:hypothetical protein